MNTKKAMAVVIFAALIIIGIAAWILWDVLYLDMKPFIIAVCVMFIIAGVIIAVGYPMIRNFYGGKEKEDRYESSTRRRNTYIILFVYIVIVASLAAVLTIEHNDFDISYSVSDDIREYTVNDQTCAEYTVSIDLSTFDTSSESAFNKQIEYLYKEVINGDGYYRHTVLVYEEQAETSFAVAMVTDGHEWAAGWLITPNEEFYKELFKN